MYAETQERILIPLDSPQKPARAFVCVEGVAQAPRVQQPVLLGPSVPVCHIYTWTISDQAYDQAREFCGTYAADFRKAYVFRCP
jgi:hypothetical protein